MKSNQIHASTVNNILTNNDQYICLSWGCSNGYKFDDNKKVKNYKKNCYLEKYIKKNKNNKNFDRMKVSVLFNKMVNEILGLNLKRKRIKFN